MPKQDATELLSINGHEVRVSNPDKLYFSKETKLSKLDLVRYYLSVAPGALAGIRGQPRRPISFQQGLHLERDRAHVRPIDARTRIEVNPQLVW